MASIWVNEEGALVPDQERRPGVTYYRRPAGHEPFSAATDLIMARVGPLPRDGMVPIADAPAAVRRALALESGSEGKEVDAAARLLGQLLDDVGEFLRIRGFLWGSAHKDALGLLHQLAAEAAEVHDDHPEEE